MLTVRDLDPDHLDAALDLRTRSFGPMSEAGQQRWRGSMLRFVEHRRLLGAYDGDELVGTARARGFTQYWGGRPVPMAGIQGVVVAPHARGRGVATTVLLELVRRAAELGDVVSALYPATVVPYRRLGWELAGVRQRVTVDSSLLRALQPGAAAAGRVRRALPADAESVLALLADRCAADRATGPVLWDLHELREDLADPEVFSYLTDGGFLSYGWDGGDLVVQALVAGDPDVARSLWAVVGSGASSAPTVHAWVAPHDPLPRLVADNVGRASTLERWMLRLLDAPAAVAARGFAPSVTGSARLAVVDDRLPAAGGDLVLEVASGEGVLTPSAASADALRLHAGGLAALYAGTPVRGLRAAGLASGGTPTGDDLLDAALAGPPAYLLDHF